MPRKTRVDWGRYVSVNLICNGTTEIENEEREMESPGPIILNHLAPLKRGHRFVNGRRKRERKGSRFMNGIVYPSGSNQSGERSRRHRKEYMTMSTGRRFRYLEPRGGGIETELSPPSWPSNVDAENIRGHAGGDQGEIWGYRNSQINPRGEGGKKNDPSVRHAVAENRTQWIYVG
ncbi:hypothetical protein C8J57DRAFT_1244980 [Mycena rebaudengoi]|nr:hypothetical protein C8J57DRAFT_1244980 [Mycena rebaudengoi]